MNQLAAAVAVLLLVTLCSLLAGCTLTVAPDGTRTWAMSGAEAAHAIEILSNK